MQSPQTYSVDQIFARMSVIYGSTWATLWLGLDLDEVRREWDSQLGWYLDNHPQAIEHALAHLPPDRPPNALQFKVICTSAPDVRLPPIAPQLPGMPDAKPDISRLRAAFKRFKELRAELKKKPLQWAYDLQEREKRGESLTEQQRRDWRIVLATKVSASTAMQSFSAIDPNCLPPAMRDEHLDQTNKRLA